ncbi:hypothetical protein ONZ45_g6644 [Pleurotus djamor]|nr:hypothetical protein ONZ45_g6644 [Pleurotus djamor]
MTAKEMETLLPDAKARQKALNFLLAKGLIKALQSSAGLVFRGVSKNELDATKDLTAEEALVYSHIQGSKNEGIWTKQLNVKTNLHRTVIDRCIKTLVQKSMIKRVPSVQHPTRKIYMVEGLEPSIALTGGPWYTDNELDTEFIKLLMNACLRFIQEKSFPKRRNSSHSQDTDTALYPISNAPEYPTAQNIRTFLKQSRITDTDLSVEHVEMLLNVLVLDGEIEKVWSSCVRRTLWDSNAINDDVSSDDQRSKKKRKGTHDSDTDSDSHSKRKKKRSKSEDSTKRKKKSTRKRYRDEDGDDDSEPSSKKKKAGSESGSDTDGEDQSETASSDSESESDGGRGKSKKRKSSKRRERSSSPVAINAFEDFMGGANIYRAVKQEKMALGWSQAPCGDCPSFDFCKDDGPVNPKECQYFEDFLRPILTTAPIMLGNDEW